MRNVTDRPFFWSTCTSKTYDFYVLASTTDQILWRWSRHSAFNDEILFGTVDPGDFLTYVELWDQRDDDGVPLAPGRYYVVGSFESECHPLPDFFAANQFVSARMTIWILP